MKICLDPGHGGRTSGAVGKYSSEKNINLQLALKLRDRLVDKGIDIVLTRSDDRYVSLQRRCDIANNAECDYFISIHCNGYSDPSANGTSTYYYKGSRKSFGLAEAIQNASAQYSKTKYRGVKTTDFYVLVNTKMPAVLHETMFITNPREENILNRSEWQDGFADAIASAIINHLGITPVEEKKLYKVFLDGIQKGIYKIKENALRKAQELLESITSGNVKIVAVTPSEEETMLDETMEEEKSPEEDVLFEELLDSMEEEDSLD